MPVYIYLFITYVKSTGSNTRVINLWPHCSACSFRRERLWVTVVKQKLRKTPLHCSQERSTNPCPVPSVSSYGDQSHSIVNSLQFYTPIPESKDDLFKVASTRSHEKQTEQPQKPSPKKLPSTCPATEPSYASPLLSRHWWHVTGTSHVGYSLKATPPQSLRMSLQVTFSEGRKNSMSQVALTAEALLRPQGKGGRGEWQEERLLKDQGEGLQIARDKARDKQQNKK